MTLWIELMGRVHDTLFLKIADGVTIQAIVILITHSGLLLNPEVEEGIWKARLRSSAGITAPKPASKRSPFD